MKLAPHRGSGVEVPCKTHLCRLLVATNWSPQGLVFFIASCRRRLSSFESGNGRVQIGFELRRR